MKRLSDFYVKAGAKDHRNDDYNTAYDNGDEHVMMNKRMRLRGIWIFGHQPHLQKQFLKEYILRVQCPGWRRRRLSYGGAQAPAGQIRRRKPPRDGLPWLGFLAPNVQIHAQVRYQSPNQQKTYP